MAVVVVFGEGGGIESVLVGIGRGFSRTGVEVGSDEARGTLDGVD